MKKLLKLRLIARCADLHDTGFIWECIRYTRMMGYFEEHLQDEAGISGKHFLRMKKGTSVTTPDMKRKLEAGLEKILAKR